MSDLAFSPAQAPARPALIGWLAVLATVTIWAVWAVATRHAVTHDLPPSAVGLLRFGVPEKDVADATQDVFAVVHRKLGAFEGRSEIDTWVHGICRRVAADYRRRACNRHEVLSVEPDHVARRDAVRAERDRPPGTRAERRGHGAVPDHRVRRAVGGLRIPHDLSRVVDGIGRAAGAAQRAEVRQAPAGRHRGCRAQPRRQAPCDQAQHVLRLHSISP